MLTELGDDGSLMAEISYDESVELAWGRFAVVLDHYLSQMRVGDSLILESHYDAPAREPARIAFSAHEHEVFRCEVPAGRQVHPLRSITEADLVRLAVMGFAAADGAYRHEAAAGEMQRLVLSAMLVLREIWALPHPEFLRAAVAGRPDVPEFDAFTPEIDEDAPESSLHILVESAIEKMFGGPLDIDEEGVITLEYKGSDVYLRVLAEDRYIDIYAAVLDVSSRDCVEEYDITREVLDAIPTLNRQWPAVKWHLEENVLLGVIRIDGAPFMAGHLTRALEALGALLDSADDILTELSSDAEAAGHPGGAALLGYRRPESHEQFDLEPARDSAAADTIVAVLRLNSGATRHLGDDEVADLCEGDVDLVLECLRIAKAQLSLWGGDHAAEQESWGLVVDKLLGAIAVLSQP